MRRIVGPAVIVGVVFALLSPESRASGGSPMPRPGGASSAPAVPRKTAAEEAVDHYNAGLKLRDKALDYQKQEARTTSEKDRAKLEKKAQQEFVKSIDEFRMATVKDPRFYQAYSDLGFALRKTGDYAAALETYDHALGLAPTYSPALEYRGEAYLALDRVEDAKKAYMALFTGDRGEADALLKAMQGWVEKRRAAPGALSADAVQEFSKWVDERAELAGQTPSVSELQQRRW